LRGRVKLSLTEKVSVVISLLSFFAASASAIAAFRSYQLSKNLAKVCNLFPSVHKNRLIITSTSTSERLLAHEIKIKVHRSWFKSDCYSISQLYYVHEWFQKSCHYDAVFPTLFERGLTIGESYEFPIAELFEISTNRIIVQKNPIGLKPDTLVSGMKATLIFMLNGTAYSVKIIINQELIDEIISGKKTYSHFILRQNIS
jgi:hypothetical protein